MAGLTEATKSVQRAHTNNSGVASDFAHTRFRDCALLFAGAFLVLFLLSNRIVNLYDEGLFLTAVMRTMAGQVLHRDFYYNYGPAQLYVIAGLFKVFGPSVLVQRLAATFSASCMVVSIYVLAHKFCSRAISLMAAALCVIWIVGTIIDQSFMNSTMPVLVLWPCWLIIPVVDGRQQRRRAAFAGLICGALFLFRYDMGAGLAAANLFAACIMLWIRDRNLGRALYSFATRVVWPYLAGFSVVVLPASLLYLSAAPLHDFLYDIVLYSAKYYAVSRRLPFPSLRLGQGFADFVVYLLPFFIALSLWAGVRWGLLRKRSSGESGEQASEAANLLIALGVAAVVMYAKGFVRLSADHVAMSTMPCLVMAAILFQRRQRLKLWIRVPFAASILLLFLSAVTAAHTWLMSGWHMQPLVMNWLATPNRQPPEAELKSWCQFETPITRGMCFLLDSDHIRTVEYIDTHTSPAATLYVGLPHHDRIYINDNITYFAAQRLPATKWSHFDPFLQNREDIQHEMIGEMERNRPPYIVLDSEFDNIREPNGSSVSTGVHLLDDYIAAHYKTVQQYGEMTILQRQE